MRESQRLVLSVSLALASCILVACGGDDVGDNTPAADASHTGGGGGSSGKGGAAGSNAGNAGQNGGSGGQSGGSSGNGGQSGTAGQSGSMDGGPDVKAEAAPDVSSEVGSDTGGMDAKTEADVGADVSSDAGADAPAEVGPGVTDSSADSADAKADVADAGTNDGGDGGVTTSSQLSGKSASCLTCAQAIASGTLCSLAEVNCEIFTDARRQSCLDTLSCVLPSSCTVEETSDVGTCYCGTAGANCLTAGAANGVCKSVIETGLASTDANYIAAHLVDETFGAGMAMKLVQCLADYQCQDCF